jgi:hypothetical protein
VIRKLATLFLTLMMPSLAAAQSDGEVDQGFTFKAADGLWWQGGAPFTRSLVTTPGGYYYRGRCCYQYPATTSYSYQRAALVVKQNTKIVEKLVVPPYSPDWKIELTKYMDARNDREAYLQAISALGVPVQQHGYAQSHSTTVTAGSSADTLYGYSVKALQAYNFDTSALYQQAYRLAQSSQEIGSKAVSEHNSLVQVAAESNTEAARIIAKGLAAGNVLKALEGPATLTTTSTTVGPAPAQMPLANDAPRLDPRLVSLLQNKCIQCHGPSAPKGNLDLTKWAVLDATVKQKVLERTLTQDGAKRMPRNVDGSAGLPLSLDEIRLLLQ